MKSYFHHSVSTSRLALLRAEVLVLLDRLGGLHGPIRESQQVAALVLEALDSELGL